MTHFTRCKMLPVLTFLAGVIAAAGAAAESGTAYFFKGKSGKRVKTRISGSRTNVKIAGKDDRRKNIEPGMVCEVTYPGPGQEAKRVSCT